MAWRLARSLVVLRDEVRTLHPGTTVWDIGDQDHQDEPSDHNPNPAGVVCASDTLGDAGLHLGWYAEKVRTSGHRALKYVIYDRRIASARSDPPWSWRPYGGSNPHTGHVHVSVGVGPDGQSTGPYDDESPWGLLEGDMATEVDLIGTRVKMADDDGNRWSFGNILGRDSITANAALGYGAAGGWQIRTEVVPALKAVLAHLAGEDVAEAAAQASRAAVRDEFIALGPELADKLGDVPAERVEAALRAVLGSLDETAA